MLLLNLKTHLSSISIFILPRSVIVKKLPLLLKHPIFTLKSQGALPGRTEQQCAAAPLENSAPANGHMGSVMGLLMLLLLNL